MGQGLSIVIVNYKTPYLVIDCLRSIYLHTSLNNLEILVVDNCSEDSSKEIITTNYPDVLWVQNEQNEGFGRANNLGISRAKYDTVLLLNSDTVIFDNSIDRLFLRFKQDSPNIMMATCQLVNDDMSLQKSVFYYNSSFTEFFKYNIIFEKLMSKFRIRERKEIMAIHGACLIFNKSKMESIGYFDPDFFLYAEEFEWCYRIVTRGYRLKLYDDIQIKHLEAQSSVSKEWNDKQRNISIGLLFKKNRGTIGYMIFLSILVFNIFTNLCLLWKMNTEYRKEFMYSVKIQLSLIHIYILILLGTYSRPLKFS